MTALNKVLKKGVLLGPAFKLHQLVLKKDKVPTIFNFPMESCKLAIGKNPTKTKRMMPSQQLENSSAISQIKYRISHSCI